MQRNTYSATQSFESFEQAGAQYSHRSWGIITRNIKLLAALAVLVLMGIRPAAAQSDQDNTNPVGWNWLKGVTTQALSTYLNNNKARITDLQYVGNGQFDAVVVSNTGTYQKAWWWYTGITLNQALNNATTNHARITVIAPYLSGTNLLCGVAMISNTGADAAAWAIYFGNNAANVINNITTRGGRVMQFKPYGVTSTGTAGYVGVGVANDARKTSVLTQVNAAQITTQINTSPGYRVVEILPDFNGTFTAILDTESVGIWYAYANQTSDFMWGIGTFDQVRPISIAPSGTLFDAAFIMN